MSRMLNRYIRVAGDGWNQLSEAWLLVIDPEPLPDEVDKLKAWWAGVKAADRVQERLVRKYVQCHNWEKGYPPNDIELFLQLTAKHKGNYKEIAMKHNSEVLVQESGGYCLPNDKMQIIEERIDYDYPIENETAKIVIIENDVSSEYKWRDYLKRRFPGEKITVRNLFDTYQPEYLKKFLADAEYVTFSTTFSSFYWWDLLNESISDKHKVIGYSHQPEKWAEALERFDYDVEIVEDWTK